jgi:hypothetical protein
MAAALYFDIKRTVLCTVKQCLKFVLVLTFWIRFHFSFILGSVSLLLLNLKRLLGDIDIYFTARISLDNGLQF